MGCGRLGFNAYTQKSGLWHEICIAGLLCLIYMVPLWLFKAISFEGLSLTAWIILVIAIPQLVIGIIMTYILPRLSNKLINYPETLPEVTEIDSANDPEKGKEVRNVQIKGKNSSLMAPDTLCILYQTYK